MVPAINRIYAKLDSKPGEFVDNSNKVFNFNCLFQQYVMEWAIPV
jgi:L-gulonolactone oxidase